MSKTTPALRVLHTSDWHLGRMLFDQKRYPEFEKFLDWLAETIENEHVNALLVAGDIFDTGTPSNRALELYYRFLARIARLPLCRHIIIIGGNHDSPSLLDAPNTVLNALNVHVRGGMSENPEDEVLLLKDASGTPELVVCAVPFLRDKDVRTSEAGESADDKQQKMQAGIRNHYADVTAIAERLRKGCHREIPLIGMGHLFAAGAESSVGEGVRNLYIGAECRVTSDIFGPQFDYVALGHIHKHYRLNNNETRRYCGAPLHMGFSETGQQKAVCLVDFNGRTATVQELAVPVFQTLERIAGDNDAIISRILELKAANSNAWLEISYNGPVATLRERMKDALKDSELIVLRLVNENAYAGILQEQDETETLASLSEEDVFLRLLDDSNTSADNRDDLLAMFREVVLQISTADRQAD